MSAGLTDSDSMFSVRETPWHGLGAVLDRPPATIREAIEASGLGWNVAKEPIAIHRGGTPPDLARAQEIPGYYATVRLDTADVLGIRRQRRRGSARVAVRAIHRRTGADRHTNVQPSELGRFHPVAENLVLAATERAQRHDNTRRDPVSL
jgi:hypothetical protein